MDDHQLKSSLQCEDEVCAAQEQGSHPQFGFLEGGRGQDEHGCGRGRSHQVPKRSKRDLRARNPGRDLRVTAVSRPLEEMQLERAIASHLPPGKSLRLRLTENRYTIISVQRGQHGYRVRTHRMFAGVEPRLVRALARYVAHNDQRASNLLGEFIERNKHRIASEPRRKRRLLLRTRGQHHDLSAVFDRLNRAYFAGTHAARITWGTGRRLANHPALDQEGVPGYFLNWIVFHEMLHGKHAIRRVGGRRCYHPPEFAEEERHLPDYQRARLWEKTHMDRLLGR
jgi:hypothetical protein